MSASSIARCPARACRAHACARVRAPARLRVRVPMGHTADARYKNPTNRRWGAPPPAVDAAGSQREGTPPNADIVLQPGLEKFLRRDVFRGFLEF